MRIYEQVVRDLIDDSAVLFLRHTPVETSHARLVVDDFYIQLCRRDRGQRGVGVSQEHTDVRLLLRDRVFSRYQEPAGLFRVSAAADLEVHVGLAYTELIKENGVHRSAVMLAGMYKDMLQRGHLVQSLDDLAHTD